MKSNEYTITNNILSMFFIIIPTLLLILGYFYYPINPTDNVKFLIQIPIFLGLIFLFIGFLTNKYSYGKILKIFGWIIFAFYWSTQPLSLYANEGDFVTTIERISECSAYKEATEILKGVFFSYRVSPYSKEAVLLTNAVSNFFRQT